ncbi:MAG TPA: S9 family peptidase [Steroidobacteraceae bacterium]|nr:S9 family peptidase [Steroidobacteraceae bacterium]
MAYARLVLVAAFIPFCLTACSTPMKHTPPVFIPATAVANSAAVSHPAPVPQPPVAAKKPHQVSSPNGSREDEYYWLRDDKRESPEMLAYVKAENAYADAMMAHTEALEEKVYQEIIGRLQQDDSSVPYLMNGYWYYRRFETGKEYPIYARRKASEGAAEEILLNVNELARNQDFFEVGDIAISPNSQLMAWAEDTVGRRQYVVKVMDLTNHTAYPIDMSNVENNIVWAGDNKTFFYIEKDPETLLGFRVRSHDIDSANHKDVSKDPVVWTQDDESFYTQLYRTKDENYIVIHTQSTVSTEVWYADAHAKKPEFKLFLARERDHEYQVEHANGQWIVRTNWQAKNFRIVSVAKGAEGDRTKWRDVVAHRDDAFVDAYDVSKRFLTIEEHSGGLRKLRIRPWTAGSQADHDVFVTADEPSYTMALDTNREFDSEKLRYTYTSMVTPRTTYDYEFDTGKRELLKREPVLGGYDPSNYQTEFGWATARDGTRVPVSIVYRKTTPRNGTAPLLQIGYGSYGSTYDPEFSYLYPSLLDRGFVIAIAHIRGGQEMGRAWYENGKLLNKVNTFTDFIDVTRWLAANKYSDARRAFALGRSAGGLLMGAIANLAPQDYRGIVAGVPFVDVVTTMLDESIPLTTNEFDEWGNPKQKPYYDYMLSYSPYDNLGSHDYPAMFVHSGLWDSQVQYFEPTKYVARLRARRTGDSLIVLRTNMEAGHGGKSGRYEHYREYAEQYAFILDQAGLTQ